MTKLTETRTISLSAGVQRPENIALPLPKGLAGAAAKMAVNRMIALGWLQEVYSNLRRGEPLWRETGDGPHNAGDLWRRDNLRPLQSMIPTTNTVG